MEQRLAVNRCETSDLPPHSPHLAGYFYQPQSAIIAVQNAQDLHSFHKINPVPGLSDCYLVDPPGQLLIGVSTNLSS